MPTLTPTRPPRAHQAEALRRAKGRAAYFYMLEMGLGKSKIALDEVLQLYLDGEIDRALIVAGKGSYSEWMTKHLPENTPEDILVLAHLWDGGSTRAERAAIERMMTGPPALRCLIVNVEAFGSSAKAETVARNFVAGGRTMIVCDESAKIRKVDANRTKVMIELGRLAAYRRAMTGLAMPKNLLDLWGQMSFLGLEHVLGSNFFTFRARFCTTKKLRVGVRNQDGTPAMIRTHEGWAPKTRSVEKITGVRNIDLLRERLEPHRFRVLKADCLDLPPKIYERASVELTPQQRTAYADMVRRAMTEIEDGVFASARHAMTRIMRLHQIVCGHLIDEEGVLHTLDSNRLSIMEDVIDEMNGKVAVWCAYQEDVRSVTAHIRKTWPDRRVVQYYGPTPPAERREALEAFQNGRADFWVATAQTGGVGVTLTACSNVIYFSNSFDLEHRLQSEDRFHRDGQTRAVTYVDLVAPRTVDERILKVLAGKKSVSDEVMDGGPQAWLTPPD